VGADKNGKWELTGSFSIKPKFGETR
jgi:hypothetical protein